MKATYWNRKAMTAPDLCVRDSNDFEIPLAVVVGLCAAETVVFAAYSWLAVDVISFFIFGGR